MRVEDGKIVVPGGNRYEAISVPRQGRNARMEPLMQLAAVRQIKRLLEAGATVIDTGKPMGSPGLENDEEVRRLADEVWSTWSGQPAAEKGGRLVKSITVPPQGRL